jgi:hypothetical protein
MFFKTTMIAVALVSVATMAHADAAAGDARAANLTSQVRSLVFAGKIARAEGRDNATAAGECVCTRLQ